MIVRTEGHCINRLCVSRLENQLWSVAQDRACICRGLRWSGRHANTALVRFFRLREAVDGQKYFKGRLGGIDDNAVLIDADDGRRHRVPIEVITRANLEVEF